MKLTTIERKRYRIRKKLKKVSNDRYRLSISRSSKNISAQIIDDTKNITLVSASSIDKEIKATNYQIDTYKKKIYVYGIALTPEEKELVVKEAKEILDVEDVVASILIVDDLRIQKN